MADTTELLIDAVFMHKLVFSGLYGEPKEGLADRLKERAPRGLTDDGANAAAEHIIRTHASGAFPKFPACLAALTKFTGPAALSLVPGAAPTAVTRETYVDRSIAFCKRAGVNGFHAFALERDKQESQWLTWQAYFRAIDMPSFATMMQSSYRWTVPTEWPWEFDLYSPVVSAVQPPVTMGRSPRHPMMQAAE